ncbi:MAG: hypothetical protein ABR606_02145 [Vicinamibacterales bacterium]
MQKKLFAKNFLKIQTPPTLKITERKDGALVIGPPAIGGFGQTITNTDTAVGSITKSDTETHAGTSTDTATSTSTQGAVTLLDGGKSFPIVNARIDSARPERYQAEGEPNKDSFEVVTPIPKGSLEGDDNTKLAGEPAIRDFSVGTVARPPLDEATPTFTLPDLGQPWDGSVNQASDDDSDNDGDEDDVPDSDHDNDSDDEGDRDDDHDFLGAAGYDAIRQHTSVKPPLAPEGTKGRLSDR